LVGFEPRTSACAASTFILYAISQSPGSSFIYFYLFLIFLLGIFLFYISNAIPKDTHTLPPPHSPTHPLPLFGPGVPLYWGHMKFACPMGLSFQWWPTRPSFDTYAARVKSSGELVSS
jgi:hypothetical protein